MRGNACFSIWKQHHGVNFLFFNGCILLRLVALPSKVAPFALVKPLFHYLTEILRTPTPFRVPHIETHTSLPRRVRPPPACVISPYVLLPQLNPAMVSIDSRVLVHY